MLAPDISKCWELFLISALLSLALQKISCFNLTAFSSEICCENVLCVAGCCRRDIAAKTRRVMCVMTLRNSMRNTVQVHHRSKENGWST